MNPNIITTMLRLNQVEDCVQIVLAQSEARIEATLEAAVLVHNSNPTPITQAFLERCVELRPQNVRPE